MLPNPRGTHPAPRPVAALGPVAHLYAPNTYHHRWVGEWADAPPSAKLHTPAGLARRRPDLRIARHHDAPDRAPEPDFAGVVEEHTIAGFMLAETVLFVAPARTLVVADLVHNIGRPEHRWTRLYARAMGFYDRVALSRMLRTAFRDRRAARRSLPGHGAPLAAGAREALAAAYTWLPALATAPTG